MDSHREHVVNACTTLWPDANILTPPLSVATIQHGRSPVKNTPEYVWPGAGEVTNGSRRREMRFCSARTDLCSSSACWMSNALDRTLMNLTRSVEDRVEGRGSVGGAVATAS